MGTKKIAFEVSIGIPQSTVKEIISHIEEHLWDQYELKMKLKDNADVMKLIQDGIRKSLDYAVGDIYGEEVLEWHALEKLFKKEIAEAEAKYEAKCRAEEEAEYARRQMTSGTLRMHPDKLAEAKKLLKAAGIEAII